MAKSESEAERNEGFRLGDEIRRSLRQGIKERETTPAMTLMEEINKEKGPLFKRDILWKLRIVGPRQVNSFTRELAILLSSGIPLLRCLRSLAKRTGNEKFRDVIGRIGSLVEGGSSFWEALAAFPRYFSKLYVSIVKAGEVSGQLDSVLSRLAQFGEREYMLRRRIMGSLLYPAIVVVLAVIVSVIISIFMVPVFVNLFKELKTGLPLITRVLIATGNLLPHFWYVLVLIPLFLVGAYILLIRTIGGRLLIDRLKLKLPIIGGIVLTTVAARFARTFATLLHSGVPILESLSITRETAGNEVVAMDLESIRNGVERGQTLESSLQKSTVFPPLLVDMIIVGEQAGNLDAVLTQIADVYDEEVNISMSNLTTIIEPLLILGMGLVVAFVFSSFFVPYIDLITAMGQM